MAHPDPFLAAKVSARHDSPFQRYIRELAPMSFGVVLLPWPGMTEDDLRAQFRTMRELGFNSIKQFMATPEWSLERLRTIALEEGIVPWWYGEAGGEPITEALLTKLGLPAKMSIQEARSHPKVLEHQRNVMAQRIKRQGEDRRSAPLPNANDPWIGVGHSVGAQLDEGTEGKFIDWCERTYKTVDRLNEAWNTYAVGILSKPFTDWADVRARFGKLKTNEYGHQRDILRFKADAYLASIRRSMEAHMAADPHEPFRAGGEMGLFLPFSHRATDMEGIANLLTERGSFYPSIHMAWHYEEADFELPRTIYMQASLAADWFKGGWSATWESTGGPQQLSGGKGWTPDMAERPAGFTIDEGTMTQLQLSYLAGGFRGVGLWAWNPRTAGWEAGEYGLLDRNRQVTRRAIRAGAIAKAANRLRDELWDAHKEPAVGVFQCWDNEAIWACISIPNRDGYRNWPIRSRVGVTRALINANVPWEHVTATELREGLAARYRTIYLPSVIALCQDLIPVLEQYVRDGGRLVADMPSFWYDERGKLMDTGPGSAFQRLFGATLDDFQYANNRPYPLHIAGLPPIESEGFVATLSLNGARDVGCFADGALAATEHSLGKGTAVLIGASLSLMCRKPGNVAAERAIVHYALAGEKSPIESEAIVYRIASKGADHYFLINDAEARSVHLRTKLANYSAVEDAMTGQALDWGAPIALEAHSGRWLRCVKKRG